MRSGKRPESGLYFNNDVYFQSKYFLEPLLVAVGHGRSGAAGAWAADRLMHLGTDPMHDPDALLSPYIVANTLSVLSASGGGSDLGHDRDGGHGPGLNGYEVLLHAGRRDSSSRLGTTATGSDLFKRNLYFRTRADGFLKELDAAVEMKTAANHFGSLQMEMAAGLLQDGKAIEVLNRSPNWKQCGFIADRDFIESFKRPEACGRSTGDVDRPCVESVALRRR